MDFGELQRQIREREDASRVTQEREAEHAQAKERRRTEQCRSIAAAAAHIAEILASHNVPPNLVIDLETVLWRPYSTLRYNLWNWNLASRPKMSTESVSNELLFEGYLIRRSEFQGMDTLDQPVYYVDLLGLDKSGRVGSMPRLRLPQGWSREVGTLTQSLPRVKLTEYIHNLDEKRSGPRVSYLKLGSSTSWNLVELAESLAQMAHAHGVQLGSF